MGRKSLFRGSRGQRISIISKSKVKIQGHSSTKMKICQIIPNKQAPDLIKRGGVKNTHNNLHVKQINSRATQSNTERSSGSSTSGFRRLTSTLNASAGAIGVPRNSYPPTYCVRPRLLRFRKIMI